MFTATTTLLNRGAHHSTHMDNEFYTTLAVDIGRVLTTGPRAEAMLGALADPWSDDAEESEFLPPALRSPAQRPPNMTDWLIAKEKAARKPFEPHWDEILRRVRRREFKTQKLLAAAYRKPATWASQFKTVALKQKALTTEEWGACFTGSKGNRGEKRHKNPTTVNQHLTHKEN